MLGAPLPGIQLGNFPHFRVSVADRPLSGFHFFGVSFRGFHPFRNFNSGISAFSGFQFGDPRLFGVSIRGFPPFRVFNSEIPAFSGFQFGDFRFFGVSIRGFSPSQASFRGFSLSARDPHSEGFSCQFWEFCALFGSFQVFFSGKWVHFRVFFRAVGSISGFLFGQSGPFRASGSISGVLFGQVGPFRGLFSGDWVHFGFFGGHRVHFGYFIGAIGSFFFFLFFQIIGSISGFLFGQCLLHFGGCFVQLG